jgi:hypothetical protein
MTGYSHPRYAASFAGVGVPRQLPRCGGWIIERAIDGSSCRDATGAYPLFSCADWGALPADLAALRSSTSLVSLTLVADPFSGATPADLACWFDVVVSYKPHYIVDLQCPWDEVVSRHHARSANRALRRTQVTVCRDPMERLGEWCGLYEELAARHDIRGVQRFSRPAFAHQLAVPGLVMLEARVGGDLAGLHLWYVQDDVAYGHLGATNALGYQSMASYALYATAIEHFRERARWMDLGGTADAASGPHAEGLARFKAGWATGTRQAYLCGSILQPETYRRLTLERGAGHTTFFPAYRHSPAFATSRAPDAAIRT